jgi:ribonuclease E
MLINAQRPEQLRIAIMSGSVLESFQIDVAESGLSRGNIYRGVIATIQPSLNAAFIEYGAPRNGFLAIQDVVPEAYYQTPRSQPPRIDEILERGKPIVVQVAKDAIGQKGAALTTSLSLAGRYIVLTPFDETRGVSRKVEDEDIRKKLKQLAVQLEVPSGCGVIMRTNALEQTKTTISRDCAALLRLWKRVQSAALSGEGSRLLYSDQDLIVQALRDQLDSSISEVLVDDEAAYQKAKAYMDAFMPRARTQLIRYEERLPLFSRYDVETQIARIYERRVELPSGGSIVIEATEALTAIDVNSGRSTRAATQEETALNTNLEAAEEVARQLRMRDLAGLIVVDFIDMRASKNQRRVEKTMREAMKADRARSTTGRISPNGLLEINRQRIQQALEVRTHRPCPTCAGAGRLPSPEMVTLNLLRRIEARAATGQLQRVRIGLHPELSDAMQNLRRHELTELESEFDIKIEIIAAAGLHRPDEQIEWFKREQPAAPAAPTPPRAAEPPHPPRERREAPAPSTATSAAPDPHPRPESSEGTDAKGNRKRRRGGRRRRRGEVNGNTNGNTNGQGNGNGDGDGNADHTESSAQPEDHSPALEAPPVSEDTSSAPQVRREKRPRRRRRSRSGGNRQGSETSSDSSPDSSSDSASDSPSEASGRASAETPSERNDDRGEREGPQSPPSPPAPSDRTEE